MSADLFKAVLAPLPRTARQKAIEQFIVDFNPDAVEAQEILDAITASVKFRYEDDARDALEYANEFRASLDELDRTTSARAFEPEAYQPEEVTP